MKQTAQSSLHTAQKIDAVLKKVSLGYFAFVAEGRAQQINLGRDQRCERREHTARCVEEGRGLTRNISGGTWLIGLNTA